MQPDFIFPNSSMRAPQDCDPVLQILKGKIDGSMEKTDLVAFYLFLLEKDKLNKVKFSDRNFYNYLLACFIKKLTVNKIEIPGVFKIEDRSKNMTQTVEKQIKREPVKEASITKKIPIKVRVPVAYDIRFIEHLSHPDGTEVKAGEKFVKKWSVSNPSNDQVPVTTKVKSAASNNLNEKGLESIPFINPKEKEVISVDMQAPEAPGSYTDYFRFIASTGEIFGDSLSCRIVVKKEIKPDPINLKYCEICKSTNCSSRP